MSFANFFESLRLVCKNAALVGVLGSVINLFLFLNVGLRTMIPMSYLLLVYLAFAITALAFVQKKTQLPKGIIACCVAPLILNILLVFNFFISFDPKQETYQFGSARKEAIITLKDHAYDDYPGIRVFADIEQLKIRSYIRYTFKTGIFGIRIISHYELLWAKDG